SLTEFVVREDFEEGYWLRSTTTLSIDRTLQKDLCDASSRAVADQVLPRQMVFKVGSEDERELLLSKMILSLGILGKYVVPKIKAEFGGTLLTTKKGVKKSPLGIISPWIQGDL